MSGQNIAAVTYLEDRQVHSKLSDGMRVYLTQFTNHLGVVSRTSNEIIVAIPWNNIEGVGVTDVRKKGLSALSAELAKLVYIGDVTHLGSPFHKGVEVRYWDELLQRSVDVFFKTGGRRRARTIAREILRLKDQYTGTMGRFGGPSSGI